MSNTSPQFDDQVFREHKPRKQGDKTVYDVHPLPIAQALATEIVGLFSREQRLDFLIGLANGLTILGRFASYPDPKIHDEEAGIASATRPIGVQRTSSEPSMRRLGLAG